VDADGELTPAGRDRISNLDRSLRWAWHYGYRDGDQYERFRRMGREYESHRGRLTIPGNIEAMAYAQNGVSAAITFHVLAGSPRSRRASSGNRGRGRGSSGNRGSGGTPLRAVTVRAQEEGDWWLAGTAIVTVAHRELNALTTYFLTGGQGRVRA
jgi:hypothetical protein